MRKLFKILDLRRNTFVFLGLFVAAFIVSHEIIEHQCNLVYEELNETDNDKETDDDALTFSITSDALVPVFGIELEPFQQVLIAEVINEVEVEMAEVEEVSLYNSHHFKTLFRQIQSPNAP